MTVPTSSPREPSCWEPPSTPWPPTSSAVASSATEPAPALRSSAWFAGTDEVAMLHRVALRLGPADAGKPVIGIADTTSALNPCNVGLARVLPEVEDAIRRAGGIPARFPVMSLGEDLMKPSAMLYRNLVAMELEEQVRAYPLDGLVALAGCDKSVPAALMAAASSDLPTLLLLAGPRDAPPFEGKPLGAGTDLWRALEQRRAGRLADDRWANLETCLGCAGPGVCNTMGTAATMGLLTEALGMALPGSALTPAGSPELAGVAAATGEAIVAMVRAGARPRSRLTQAALDNAAVVLAAIGGSTNAVIHLAAVAGRLGLDASLARFDELWREVPLLADVEPCGQYLVSQLHAAGGLRPVMRALGGLVDLDATCGSGRSWREELAAWWADAGAAGNALGAGSEQGAHGAGNGTRPGAGDLPPVVASLRTPVLPAPAMAAVHGNLAPRGAVIKLAAASPHLFDHCGPALVFDSYADMRERLDDEALDVGPDTVVIVRGCGPAGVPGMPEWGMAPIPKRLAEQGVGDLVRVTDGRMSGTSFGTVVLHVSPEAAVGGPLALVRDGDLIRLDVAARELTLVVDDAELRRRLPVTYPDLHLRGWPKLYHDHVLQAHQGADLDFLAAPTPAHRPFIEPVVGRS